MIHQCKLSMYQAHSQDCVIRHQSQRPWGVGRGGSESMKTLQAIAILTGLPYIISLRLYKIFFVPCPPRGYCIIPKYACWLLSCTTSC